MKKKLTKKEFLKNNKKDNIYRCISNAYDLNRVGSFTGKK